MTEPQAAGRASEFAMARVAERMEFELPASALSAAAQAPAYTMGARLLHWVTAALILVMIPLGVVIANDWGGALQDQLYDLHRSIGAVLIPIVLLRLFVRWARPPAELPDDVPALQRRVARAMHACLYVLLVTQPLVGWMATSAYGAPISVFGWFDLPPICAENKAVSELLFLGHAGLGLTLGALATVHIAAALYHHFMRRDRVLMRMIVG